VICLRTCLRRSAYPCCSTE